MNFNFEEARQLPISLRRWFISRTSEEIKRNNGEKVNNEPGKGQQQISKIKDIISAMGVKAKENK